ncbi:glycosyltransferase family 4 protein [Frateuria aurantia]
MKFLLIGTNPEHTGAATHFIALAQSLLEAGHHVSAVLYPDGLIARQLADSGVTIYPAKFRNVLDVRGYVACVRAIRDHHPDWLIGNFGKEYWPILLLGKLFKVPVALFRHRTPAMSWLSALMIPRLAECFMAVSVHARQAYLDQGIAGHRVKVLHNSVNTLQFRPDASLGQRMRYELGIPADAIVVGYCGRIHGGKGIFPLLAALSLAMAEEPRLHAVWLGDGPEAEDLAAAIAREPYAHRHRQVRWVATPQTYYPVFSMLAFPSLSTETFGRVAIEAQACAVPVLASDVGGSRETLIDGATGLLLPPGDVDTWHRAILKVCDDSYRQQLGEAARHFVVSNFSNPAIAARLVEVLAQSLGSKGRGPAVTSEVTQNTAKPDQLPPL